MNYYERLMNKSQIRLAIFLSLFVSGCLLSAAHAEDNNKKAPAKAAPAKAAPTKAALTKAALTKGTPAKATPQGNRGAVNLGAVNPGTERRGAERRSAERHGEARNIDRHREIRSRADIHHFHGRDYHHWNEHERAIWREGVWRQEEYMGRFGYWWISGGQRYFYDTPVYPYPLVVAPVVYELPVAVEQPIIVEQAAPVQQPISIQQVAPAPRYQRQTVQSWYYCDNPRGYSPYITSCASGWRTVPAQAGYPTPPPAPPIPDAPPPPPPQ